MDCSVNDASRASLQIDKPWEVSSSQLPYYQKLWKNEEYCDLELNCYHMKLELKLYDVIRKSIIPSLALWSHIQSLEFDFDKEDSYLLSKFGCGLDEKAKMDIVEEVLKKKRAVYLRLYDIWSEEFKEFWVAEDYYSKLYGPPFKCDGKLVETTNGSTTIYIGRPVFRYLTALLWMEMSAFLAIRNKSIYIYGLLKTTLTTKDKLGTWEILSELRSSARPFVDILVSMKNVMEPKYHPLFRKEQKDILNQVWDYHTKKEMLQYPPKEFPFGFFRDYSEKMKELFQSKANNSKRYRTMKEINELHQKFISSPDQMEVNLQSESDFTSFISQRGEDGEILRKMCTNSLKEFKTLQERCSKMQYFSDVMENLFKIIADDEKLKNDFDSDVERLKSQGLITDSENFEQYRTSLEDFTDKWFKGLPIGYAVLGILLYDEWTSLPDDEREGWICAKVKGTMTDMVSYLTKIWEDSCYDETVFRDLHDPARAMSWCDVEPEFPESKGHKELPFTLFLEENRLKRLRNKLTIGVGDMPKH